VTLANAPIIGTGRGSQTLHPRGCVGRTQIYDGVKVETTNLRPRQRFGRHEQQKGRFRLSEIPLVCYRTDCAISLASELVQLAVSANGCDSGCVQIHVQVSAGANLATHVCMYRCLEHQLATQLQSLLTVVLQQRA
jgi:hypothetical protein